jgi:hypothetical protein
VGQVRRRLGAFPWEAAQLVPWLLEAAGRPESTVWEPAVAALVGIGQRDPVLEEVVRAGLEALRWRA